VGGRRVREGVATLSFRPPALVPYEHTRYSFGSSWTNTVRALLRLLRRLFSFLSDLPLRLLVSPVHISPSLRCSFRSSSIRARTLVASSPRYLTSFLVLLIFSDLY